MNCRNIIVKYNVMSNDELFVSMFIGNENVSLKFGLCEFVNEMEYLGVKTRFLNSGGECGFVFDSNIGKSFLEREIENFAQRYNIV